MTVKITYRSNHRANGRSTTLGATRSPAPDGRLQLSSPVAHVYEEREITSGVYDLNSFADLPKKLPEPAPVSSAETAAQNVEKAIQLDEVSTEEVQVHPGSRVIMHTDPHSVGADRFRFLRMCLRELWSAGKLKSLQITSPLPQDGKSTIALNLATALAEGGRRKVLIVEADLHRPTLTEQLGIEMRSGLADCLERRLDPASALRRLEPLAWYLLPAGEPRSNATELLQTDALANVLQKLSPHFDWILIDSPPVIPLTDALSIARQAGASLLVAREGRTPREAIERAIAILGRQRILGIVLNAVEGIGRKYSGYYGYGTYPPNRANEVGRAETAKGPLPEPAARAKHSFLDPPEQ